MIRELLHYRALLKNLVLKDLKLKYRGSILGMIWSLLHPLLLLTVYTVAFGYIIRIQMEHYAFFLMTGLLPWTFFAASLQASTGAITANGNLIRKVYFPREILPIASVLFCFAQFMLALVGFLPALALLSGVRLRWSLLAVFPMLLLLHLAFVVGIAFVLSAATTFFRDIAHLTDVGLLFLFWVTPIIYPVTMVPPRLQPLFKASPLAAFAIAYQEILLGGRFPEARVIAIILGSAGTALFGGYMVFRRLSPSLAEEV